MEQMGTSPANVHELKGKLHCDRNKILITTPNYKEEYIMKKKIKCLLQKTKPLVINRSSGCGKQVRSRTPATSCTAVPQDTPGPRAGDRPPTARQCTHTHTHTHTHTASSDLRTFWQLTLTPSQVLQDQTFLDTRITTGDLIRPHCLLHSLSPFLGGQQDNQFSSVQSLSRVRLFATP